jgi:hypothetical protein
MRYHIFVCITRGVIYWLKIVVIVYIMYDAVVITLRALPSRDVLIAGLWNYLEVI